MFLIPLVTMLTTTSHHNLKLTAVNVLFVGTHFICLLYQNLFILLQDVCVKLSLTIKPVDALL